MRLPKCFQVLKIEADVEESKEGVDKLEEHQLRRHVNIVLFLRSSGTKKSVDSFKMKDFDVFS